MKLNEWIFLLISQLSPVYPGAQLHSYEFISSSMQVPPFLHGLGLHSLISDMKINEYINISWTERLICKLECVFLQINANQYKRQMINMSSIEINYLFHSHVPSILERRYRCKNRYRPRMFHHFGMDPIHIHQCLVEMIISIITK